MFALSTAWNAYRHQSGEAMIQEIIDLGFRDVELNFSVSMEMFDQIKGSLKNGLFNVISLHNFCPYPTFQDQRRISPDMFSLSSLDEEERHWAVQQTLATFRSAEEVGARAVVVHLGLVEMPSYMRDLVDLQNRGLRRSGKYLRVFRKLKSVRDKKKKAHLDALYKSLDLILPQIEVMGILMGVETRYYAREIPALEELGEILDRFRGGPIGYWHDTGHARVKGFLGIEPEHEYLKRYGDRLIGVHFHDARATQDHRVPGKGDLDFRPLARFVNEPIIRVIEVHPPAAPAEITSGVAYLKRVLTEDNGRDQRPRSE